MTFGHTPPYATVVARADLIAPTSSASGADALIPRDRLNIGVTGHRLDRLGADRVTPVAAALDALFAEIERAARPIAPSDLRMVTSLADGADSIAADTAKAREWTLHVVLPFFRDEHAEDFVEGEPRDHYLAQVAASGAVLELPGDRSTSDRRGVAYERAGRVVLAQCDILVAVWDGGPSRGRGGAPQIVAEAVLEGIPVILVDPTGATPPSLLWDGLDELDLGQQTVETVARGGLDALPGLVRELLLTPDDKDDRAVIDRIAHSGRWPVAFAYPLLLAAMGVRRLRREDFRRERERVETMAPLSRSETPFSVSVRAHLVPRFARANAISASVAQLFRSVYVTNFVFAALAVILSLLGLILPSGVKPVLIVFEVTAIVTILVQTRRGNRAAWHQVWLDHRVLAERLRCLAISAQLGELDLRCASDRASPWVAWYARATARELGLPAGRIDEGYLRSVRSDLLALIDEQVAYLSVDADRMHRLDHRLHRLGIVLFGATVATCAGLLVLKAVAAMIAMPEPLVHTLSLAATIVSAALPAIGAAIYGIRMQGDFAGITERNKALAAQLSTLRGVIDDDVLTFDTLARRVGRATALLTDDLQSWLRTYRARPLSLPG